MLETFKNVALRALWLFLLAPAVHALAQPVVITEINYRPSEGFDTGDWVEIHNAGLTSIEIGGWTLSGEGQTNTYTIAAPRILQPGAYLVLAAQLRRFGSFQPEVQNVIGPFSFGLSAEGETVTLSRHTGLVADSVRFGTAAPWPETPNGQGFTLALRSPELDGNDPENWTASIEIGGTPGRANAFNIPSTDPVRLVINEINYHSPGEADSGDWLELVNADPRQTTADLTGWFLRDNDDTNVFVLPRGTLLDPGAFLVLAADSAAFSAIHPTVTSYVGEIPFQFSNGGERLRLYSWAGVLVDSLTYDDKAPWPTQPDSMGPTLELRATDLDNTLPDSWRASTVFGGTPGIANSVVQTASQGDPAPILSQALSVYPNPADAVVRFSLHVETPGHTVLVVRDLLGRVVLSVDEGTRSQGVLSGTLPTHTLAPGLYFVEATRAGKRIDRRGVTLLH